MTAERPLDTYITLVLEHVDAALSAAHRELYPERIPERIPFSLTLLYPWIRRAELGEAELERVRAFFAARPPLAFDLVRVAEFPGVVAYLVPEPDAELRALLRALWARYPDYPPYGEPGGDPPPHATLGRLQGEHAITLALARARVEPLLPVRCEARAATLMEEEAPDVWRAREELPFEA